MAYMSSKQQYISVSGCAVNDISSVLFYRLGAPVLSLLFFIGEHLEADLPVEDLQASRPVLVQCP